MNNQNEIVKQTPQPDIQINASGELKPTSFNQMIRMANLLAKSNFIPKSMGTDLDTRMANVMVAIQFGSELGLTPMQSVQNVSVVNGTPTIWGDAALGIVRGSGQLESYEQYFITQENKEDKEGAAPIDGDNYRAIVKVSRKGQGSVQASFSVADAKKANLYGKSGTWTTHPKRMLTYKARAFALRDLFTDLLKGLRFTEEMENVVETEQTSSGTYEAKNKPSKGVSKLDKLFDEKDDSNETDKG